MIIRSYRQALRIARSAGEDAANRRMRNAGRSRWTAVDYDHAVDVLNYVLGQLGYGPRCGSPRRLGQGESRRPDTDSSGIEVVRRSLRSTQPTICPHL